MPFHPHVHPNKRQGGAQSHFLNSLITIVPDQEHQHFMPLSHAYHHSDTNQSDAI